MNEKSTPRTSPPRNPDSAKVPATVTSGAGQGGGQQDSGFFSKISDRFNTALQNSRGGGSMPAPTPPLAQRSVEEGSIARIRGNKTQKMYVPEGVVIAGSVTGGAEAEIHGRIEGNVTLEASLYLGKSALVSGNVRASSAQVEGTVKGGIECSDTLVLTATGRLASDAAAGKQIRIAGNIEGNVKTPGMLRIEAGGIVNGDVQARVFSMSEGAELNGRCTMRAPAQEDNLFASASKGNGK